MSGKASSPKDQALIALLEPARALCRPSGCTNGPHCWVKLGWLGYTTANSDGACKACGHSPRSNFSAASKKAHAKMVRKLIAEGGQSAIALDPTNPLGDPVVAVKVTTGRKA